jgi:hypothetical protein
MKICRPRPQLVFTFDNRFSSTGCAAQQSVRYIIFRLQASYWSATSHTGRESCRVKSLYMKRFWPHPYSEPVFLTFMEPRNRFQGINSTSLCSLPGRYDNPIPTRFLAPIDCLKIPAQSHSPPCIAPQFTDCYWSEESFLSLIVFR